MRTVNIFLSSTFVDLASIRAEVRQWLSGVFGVNLVIMETFGSDADPPDVTSVRRVGECDLFVAIYAHRYGTVSEVTGKSITEMELDEAERCYSAGTIRDILLYRLDDSAEWPERHKERTAIGKRGLARLREKANRHSYSHFKNKDDLLLAVVRDIHRKLLEHFSASPLKLRGSVLPSPAVLTQPIGMEFLSSAYRQYLAGRDTKTEELVERMAEHPIVLLLGDSGVGKTSLLHSGLMPRAHEVGWRPIYVRPLGFPNTDIVHAVQANVFEGRPTYRGPILPLLAEVKELVAPQKLLLMIDQFEDVLGARSRQEVDQLVSGLQALFTARDPCLRVIISYRADLEARLGSHWQRISGSATGFPRVYLNGIGDVEAWSNVKRMAEDLSVSMELKAEEESRIREDLALASRKVGFEGIYPPYVQMFVDHMWLSAEQGRRSYGLREYNKAGGMEGVIGGYLARQLTYAQDEAGHMRMVLVALVRSYGTRAQRSLNELLNDTGLEPAATEKALEKLIDLRLVRHIGEYYEISHDFIARKIIDEVVGSEEREFKRFRELLTSKAGAYRTTENRLTPAELVMLFKYKERIIPNELELRLLFSSWVSGEGPALFWLLNEEHKAWVMSWIRSAEESEDIGPDERISLILLRKKLGAESLSADDYTAFRSYQRSVELAGLILDEAKSIPARILRSGLRHRREEVREACLNAIVICVRCGDWNWIEDLRRSRSASSRRAYEELVLRADVPRPEMLCSRPLREFALLKELVASRRASQARQTLQELKRNPLPADRRLLGEALALLREGKLETLIRKATRLSARMAVRLLAAVDNKISGRDFDVLLESYAELNSRESERYQRPAVYLRAKALGDAIRRSMRQENLRRLQKVVGRIRMTPSSRPVILALLEHGTARDVKLVLGRVGACEEEVQYWNHTALARAAARQMEEQKIERIPAFLVRILRKREFWEYIPKDQRSRLSPDDLLPLNNVANRSLYVRLAGYASIGAAGEEQAEVLLKLARHPYSLVARAAAIRLVRLRGEKGLRLLVLGTSDAARQQHMESLAEALRYSEMELYDLVSLW